MKLLTDGAASADDATPGIPDSTVVKGSLWDGGVVPCDWRERKIFQSQARGSNGHYALISTGDFELVSIGIDY